ncbi:hypothetical protein KAX02_06390 [candidate division WOR-3 bacterium]|nr:hypothetical protein [candidate division WOR-3 bacterium]
MERTRRKKGRVVEVEEAVGLSLLDEGMYPVELVEIKDIETDYGGGWRWIFDVLEEEEETLVSGITSQRMSEKSKSYGWASALMGKKPEIGDEIDLDELIGLRGNAELKTKELRDGTEVSNVIDMKKLPKQKGKKKAEEEPEEEEEEEEVKTPKKKKARGTSKKKPQKESEDEEEEEEWDE